MKLDRGLIISGTGCFFDVLGKYSDVHVKQESVVAQQQVYAAGPPSM